MKHFIFPGFLFAFQVLFGQGVPDDLPRSVLKELNNRFGKEEVFLVEKSLEGQGFPSERFYIIQSENNARTKGYLHYGRVKTCRAGGCDAPGTSSDSHDSEYFDYFIVFDPEFKVQTIKIFNYQASYGHEITARGWLKQFQGFSGKTPLEVGKNIDAISGATISVNAITEDVQWKTKLLQEVVQ